MTDFIRTADSRQTSHEIMAAIRAVAGNDAAAVRVWEDPTYAESLAVWERVTGNGQRDSSDYYWGASGSEWATAAGIDG